jgi:ABC-type phosphate transport system substrate-binding protein
MRGAANIRGLSVGLALAFHVFVPAQGQVAVIAHESVPEDSLGRAELLDIYSCDVQLWQGNSKIVLVALKERSEVRDAFYDYLGRTSARIKSLWLKRKLSGEGDPPTYLESEEEVLALVQTTPGSLGFVSGERVTPEVKVVTWIPPPGRED